MKKQHVEIKGISPLIMHRYPLVGIDGFEKLKPDEQAEHSAYRTTDGKLYVPGRNVQRCLVSAAGFVKGKGRASLAKTVAAVVFVDPEILLLPVQSYTIDSRSVVVPKTRGRIVRHRPMFNEWGLSFDVSYDETLISEKQLRSVLDGAGARIGLLDFRPECKGPFGRFMVTEWN